MSDVVWLVAVLAVTWLACALSATAGLGGSLILVPALAALVGAKEGVALAALLLGVNNVQKVVAYRDSLPWARAVPVALAVAVGAAVGARLLVAVSDEAVAVGVAAALIASFAAERLALRWFRLTSAPVLALVSGATSGFSGTSGPLKGIALRNMDFDRVHMVGAASIVSMAGDLTKTAIFADAALLGWHEVGVATLAAPLMVVAVRVGRQLNERAGERGFAWLFWSVMFGYGVRVLAL